MTLLPNNSFPNAEPYLLTINFTDLCEKKQCESWEKCVYDNNINNTKCVCREDLDCPGDFQPICGSNAKKYNNDCIMKATACREGRSIEKVANGSCSPGVHNFPMTFPKSFFY